MASHTENAASPYMNYAPADLNPNEDLPKGFVDFLPAEIDSTAAATLPEARRIAEEMIVQGRHSPT
jgi:proline dehydrogenase